MEQITVRSRARVPAINCGTGATSSRLDRHLSVLSGPAVPRVETEEATMLMREITRRDTAPSSPSRSKLRRTRVSLFAPLRKLKRTVFGGRG